jgi:predicted RNA-binding Zn-ribbon protein involved in translation (DUF1610 family)
MDPKYIEKYKNIWGQPQPGWTDLVKRQEAAVNKLRPLGIHPDMYLAARIAIQKKMYALDPDDPEVSAWEKREDILTQAQDEGQHHMMNFEDKVEKLPEGLEAQLEKLSSLSIKGTPVQPTSKEQAEAGNYVKGHTRLHGMDITIENLEGQYRKGVSDDGKEWKTLMRHHYGYIKRTMSGADGDHVDVFIGPDVKSELVYVVNQVDPKTKKFDEHKCMLGFTNAEAAKKGYLANYEKNWKGFGSMATITMKQFKDWTAKGDTSKALKGEVQKMAKDTPKILNICAVFNSLGVGAQDGYMSKKAGDADTYYCPTCGWEGPGSELIDGKCPKCGKSVNMVKTAASGEGGRAPTPQDEAAIKQWLIDTDNPKDEDFHAMAEGMGLDVHLAEGVAYDLVHEMSKVAAKDTIPGGRADKKTNSKAFPKKQMEIGAEVEMEHVDDKKKAKEISRDHLTEFPDYYTRLKKMEADAEEEASEEKEASLSHMLLTRLGRI